LSRKIKDFFTFSRAEMRGVLWLLPLLAVIAAILVFANRPRFEKSFVTPPTDLSASVYDSARRTTEPTPYNNHPRRPEKTLPEPTPFDPNTLTISGFEALGFSRRQAEVIVRYRTARGGFRTADDLARCYVVSPEMMERLRPYIEIETPPTASRRRGDSTSIASEQLPAGGGGELQLSQRESYFPVELNTADSATLRTVSGIGNALVVRILDYRTRLGGFASAEQLREIPGMYPENFDRIITQISVDSCKIRKIDINFASPEALGSHPYITADGLRKILKHRQLKGGWRTTEELVNENIITPQQAARLAPYLVFN
jgi:DNA uptake protein ComE-like DNA-binding protein